MVRELSFEEVTGAEPLKGELPFQVVKEASQTPQTTPTISPAEQVRQQGPSSFAEFLDHPFESIEYAGKEIGKLFDADWWKSAEGQSLITSVRGSPEFQNWQRAGAPSNPWEAQNHGWTPDQVEKFKEEEKAQLGRAMDIVMAWNPTTPASSLLATFAKSPTDEMALKAISKTPAAQEVAKAEAAKWAMSKGKIASPPVPELGDALHTLSIPATKRTAADRLTLSTWLSAGEKPQSFLGTSVAGGGKTQWMNPDQVKEVQSLVGQIGKQGMTKDTVKQLIEAKLGFGPNWSKTVAAEDLVNRFQAGFASKQLVNRLAAVGVGASMGALLDKDDPWVGAAAGALLGLGTLTLGEKYLKGRVGEPGTPTPKVAPGATQAEANKVPFHFFPLDTRIRINDYMDWHDHKIEQFGRYIWQQQGKIEKLAPSAESRVKITRWLDGDTRVVLSPDEQKAANLAREFFEDFRAKSINAGIFDKGLDSYVTHLWKGDKTAIESFKASLIKAGPQGELQTNSRFAKERTFLTLAQGKAAGFVPRTEDVSEIMGVYGNSMARAVTGRTLLEGLKKAEVQVSDQTLRLMFPASKAPSNYIFVNGLEGWRVHPDIAKPLKFVLDQTDPGQIKKALLTFNYASKRAAVSFSLFHHKALLDAYIGAGGNIAKIPGFLSGSDDLLKMLREGGAGDLVDDALKSGLKISLEREAPAIDDVGGVFYDGMKSIQQTLDSVLPGLGKPVGAFVKANHLSDKYLWGRLHAGMKLNIFAKEYERLQTAYPQLGKHELGKIAASYTNDIFGGLNWRMLAEEAQSRIVRDLAYEIASPSGRSTMQLLFFAPDWTLSTTRAAIKAFGGGKLKGTPLANLHRMYIARSAAYYFTVADVVNKAMSGHHLWENPDGDWTMIDMGDGRRMQFSKHAMEPVHWVTKPAQQALNKLGPAPGEILDQLLGKEYLTASGQSPAIQNRATHLVSRFVPIWSQQGIDEASVASALGLPIYGRTQKEKKEAQRKRLYTQMGLPREN